MIITGVDMKRFDQYLFKILIGILMFLQSCTSNSAHEQEEDIRPTKVRTVKAIKNTLSTVIQTTGTISPNHESYVGPKVSGRIEKIFVDEGDFAEKGRPLMSLEQIRFKLTFEETKAAHKESLAQLKNLETKLKRNQELFKKNVIDKEMLDDRITEVELARARVSMSKSRLERAEEDLRDSILYAPFSGFIVERRMNTGEEFSVLSNEYVFHIVDTSSVKVEVNIFETKKRYITIGKNVTVSVDAIPGKTFEGRITVVNPLVDLASRKFLVKIKIPNKDFALESGMFARIQIPEETRTNTLIVPARGIIEREEKKVLFVAESNKAAMRYITTGLVTSEFVEILNGVTEGENVIIDNLYTVKDKTPLQINSQ
jgi:membrane fusion protein (multidrug efflux system)